MGNCRSFVLLGVVILAFSAGCDDALMPELVRPPGPPTAVAPPPIRSTAVPPSAGVAAPPAASYPAPSSAGAVAPPPVTAPTPIIAPVPPPVTDLGSSPEAAIARVNNSLLRRDWDAWADCFTPETQKKLSLFQLHFALIFGRPDRDFAEKFGPSARDHILQQQEQRSAPYVQALAKVGIDRASFEAVPDDDVDRDGFERGKQQLNERVKDYRSLVAGLMKASRSNDRDNKPVTPLGWDINAQVQGLQVNGDRAYGRIATLNSFNDVIEVNPVGFHLINGLWKVDLSAWPRLNQ